MAGRVAVTVYVKTECKLCVPLMETVERVRQDVEFDLTKVDITGDRDLLQRYGQEVPVVLINGRKAFKGTLTEAALRKKLEKSGSVPAATGPQVEALEDLRGPRPTPPAPVALGLVALVLVGFGYFAQEGLESARFGTGRLAEKLLRVERRAELPKTMRLPGMDGQEINLDAYRGKVVFVNFWATWCPPCIEEMPSMRNLHGKLKDDPRFVMIAVSADDSWAPVKEFFQKEPPTFRVALDASGNLARQYGTEKFPETYVIVDGKIVGYIIGPRNWETWYAEAYLKALMEEGPLG
ncbi:MAG: redoxin family protein [Deltaproteobacteria bacterium]|jgi:thiol-disulfide isomerase/thioredoxin|nr:redoxin family protein [Deltaproteobacteria bacterium]